MTTCAEAIVRLLEGYGVDTVFGIPGVHTVEFCRGLSDGKIRHVTPRHEQGAGLMAYGYGLATGRPAAVSVITGAGLTNAATAIAQAYSDSVPMVVIAAGNKLREIGMGGGRLHELPMQHRLEAEIAGYSHLLLDPDNISEVMAQAFAAMDGGRPRPTIIEVPRDLFARDLATEPSVWPRITRPHADPGGVTRAAAWLGAARTPLIIAGGGCIGAAEEVRKLAERLLAPVVTTVRGKGVLESSHPLSLGSTLSFDSTQRAVQEADVVLAVGTELAETDTWLDRSGLAMDGRLIRIDVDPAQLVRNQRPDLALLGDALPTLRAIRAALGDGIPLDGTARAADIREQLDQEWPVQQEARRTVLGAIRDAVPADTFISVDSTQVAYAGNDWYPAELPNCWHFPNGFGTLGTGLPAAIGAKIASPERPVLAIAGDGGFMFTMEELAVAVEERLPIPILLWNNASYAQIRDAMVRAQVAPLGTSLQQPDFVAVAQAFGARGMRADSMEAMTRAIGDGLAADGPTLIQVQADAPWMTV